MEREKRNGREEGVRVCRSKTKIVCEEQGGNRDGEGEKESNRGSV